MSDLNLRLLLGDQPRLDHETWVDSSASREGADRLVTRYADILHRAGLAGRFGAFRRHTGGGSGWSVYIGPHEPARVA